MKFQAILFLLLFTGLISNGQCIPDTSITHNDPGIYPDSATGLPHGFAGQAYSTVIQVKVQVDSLITDQTTGFQYTAYFDSIVLTGVTGLPPGFTYSCTPSSCSFPGGSDGCITLQGPGSAAVAGSYPLIVHVDAHVTALTIPQVVTVDYNDYVLVIDSTTGIADIRKNNFSVSQNVPNPAHSMVNIPVTLAHSDVIKLTIANLIGNKVITQSQVLPKGKSIIPVDIRNLQPGIYMYSITDGKNTITKRMIVSDN